MSLSTFQEFIEEGTKIIECAQQQGITARLMGALAVKIHCHNYGHMLEKMLRAPTDIDIAAYSKDKNRLHKVLEELGYKTDPLLMSYPVYAEGGRFVYQGKTRVDIFFERLRMCHTIEWRRRLELDFPTITLADILLEKLQIVRINPKDIKDLCILFLEHDIGDHDKELINGKYIASLLSEDWGFYYTATTNMKKLIENAKEFEQLSDEQKDIIKERALKLLDMIEKSQKSLKWKMRSVIGPKVKWYNEVADDQEAVKIR